MSLGIFVGGCGPKGTLEDPLPSWNDTKNKSDIIEFVQGVTDVNSNTYVAPSDRIATFDNDGTIWSEQPYYFQLAFAMDRIAQMAVDYPEWDTLAPFSSILHKNQSEIKKMGLHGLLEVITTSHAGMNTSEFETLVKLWSDTAMHPTKGMLFKDMVYQPMLELLTYLQDNGFKTYVVSGGGVEFMRPIVSEIYNIPTEQIIGSTIQTRFEWNDGDPVIQRLPEIYFVDDKEGKPENIYRIVGKKPIFAAGNSDGDLAMMQWTESNSNWFCLYVHHTDAEREWKYDRNSAIGKLDKGLDYGREKGWNMVSMKDDWKTIFLQ